MAMDSRVMRLGATWRVHSCALPLAWGVTLVLLGRGEVTLGACQCAWPRVERRRRSGPSGVASPVPPPLLRGSYRRPFALATVTCSGIRSARLVLRGGWELRDDRAEPSRGRRRRAPRRPRGAPPGRSGRQQA